MLGPTVADVTYGERFHALRKKLWSDRDKGQTVVALAKRLDSDYPSTVYGIENLWKVPNIKTIAKHAKALGCQPWELLDGVDTEYDLLRQMVNMPALEAARKWQDLLGNYEKTVLRKPAKPKRVRAEPRHLKTVKVKSA